MPHMQRMQNLDLIPFGHILSFQMQLDPPKRYEVAMLKLIRTSDKDAWYKVDVLNSLWVKVESITHTSLAGDPTSILQITACSGLIDVWVMNRRSVIFPTSILGFVVSIRLLFWDPCVCQGDPHCLGLQCKVGVCISCMCRKYLIRIRQGHNWTSCFAVSRNAWSTFRAAWGLTARRNNFRGRACSSAQWQCFLGRRASEGPPKDLPHSRVQSSRDSRRKFSDLPASNGES